MSPSLESEWASVSWAHQSTMDGINTVNFEARLEKVMGPLLGVIGKLFPEAPPQHILS